MLTTELVLLLAIYAFLVIGLFLNPTTGAGSGVVATFHKNLPLLSARIERNVATGVGFVKDTRSGNGITWKKKP